MNAIAKPADAGGRLVAGIALPKPSPWLADAIRDAADPHPDVGFRGSDIRPGVREEAQRQLAALDGALRSADAEDWFRFLLPFAILPNAPQGRDAMRAAAGPIAFALAGTPAALLTPDNQRAGLARLKWWPTPADIAGLLAPARAEIARERAALARVAAAAPPAQSDEPTPDQRAEMAERARALAAELIASAAEREMRGRPPARAVALSDGAMLALYDRLAGDGNRAAATRAAMLRARIGGEA